MPEAPPLTLTVKMWRLHRAQQICCGRRDVRSIILCGEPIPGRHRIAIPTIYCISNRFCLGYYWRKGRRAVHKMMISQVSVRPNQRPTQNHGRPQDATETPPPGATRPSLEWPSQSLRRSRLCRRHCPSQHRPPCLYSLCGCSGGDSATALVTTRKLCRQPRHWRWILLQCHRGLIFEPADLDAILDRLKSPFPSSPCRNRA
jgi:hypothetical protein